VGAERDLIPRIRPPKGCNGLQTALQYGFIRTSRAPVLAFAGDVRRQRGGLLVIEQVVLAIAFQLVTSEQFFSYASKDDWAQVKAEARQGDVRDSRRP
jgi:hypothetical protein